MNRTKLIIATLPILLLSVGTHAAAQNTGKMELFGQFGPSFINDTTTEEFGVPSDPFFFRLEESFSTTRGFFGGYRYYITPRDGLEFSYSYAPHNLKTTFTSAAFPDSRSFTEPVTYHAFQGSYVRYLNGSGRWRPFVVGGAGLLRFSSFFSSNALTANFGGGVDFPLDNNLRFRTELRAHIVQREFVNEKLIRWAPTVGLVYTLGGSQARPKTSPVKNRVEVFILGGPTILTGEDATHFRFDDPITGEFTEINEQLRFDWGTQLFTGVRYYLSPVSAVEASYFYSRNKARLHFSIFSSSGIDISGEIAKDWMHGGAVNYVRYLRPEGKARLFIVGGVGLIYFDETNRNDLATNFGTGLDFRLSDKVTFRMEMRDWIVKKPFFSGLTHNLTPSAGLAWRF